MARSRATTTIVVVAMVFACVFLAQTVGREHYTTFDPNQYLIDNTKDAEVRENGKRMPFAQSELFGVLFGRPGVPLLLYDEEGANSLAAKVNPAHPAWYVFADLETREAELARQGPTTPLFQRMGLYWDKAGENFIRILWRNVFYGGPDRRMQFKSRFKRSQTVALLQRVALYVHRSEDLSPEMAAFCDKTSADVLASQQRGDMQAAEQGRALLVSRGCDQIAAVSRTEWLKAKVQAMRPVVWLEAANFAGGVWRDSSGNGNDVDGATGARLMRQAAGSAGAAADFNFVGGGTDASLVLDKGWPADRYTFAHVSKYNGPARERIWKSTTQNWLSGHHGGRAGVAYHNTWMHYSKPAEISPDNWLVGISSTSEARFNKGALESRRLNRYADRVKATGNPGGLNINRVPSSQSRERSDWGVAEVVVFDRTLNLEEMTALEEYLAGKLAV